MEQVIESFMGVLLVAISAGMAFLILFGIVHLVIYLVRSCLEAMGDE